MFWPLWLQINAYFHLGDERIMMDIIVKLNGTSLVWNSHLTSRYNACIAQT